MTSMHRQKLPVWELESPLQLDHPLRALAPTVILRWTILSRERRLWTRGQILSDEYHKLTPQRNPSIARRATSSEEHSTPIDAKDNLIEYLLQFNRELIGKLEVAWEQ